MYNIILTDGKIINIKANEVEWYEKFQTIRFVYERQIVAIINMNNVAGWIDADYRAESEVNK